MIDELPALPPEFPGEANHTQCFNHVIAISVMRVVHQFDVPKGDAEGSMSDAEYELQILAEGLDLEEAVTQQEREVEDDEEEDDDVVNCDEDEPSLFD